MAGATAWMRCTPSVAVPGTSAVLATGRDIRCSIATIGSAADRAPARARRPAAKGTDPGTPGRRLHTLATPGASAGLRRRSRPAAADLPGGTAGREAPGQVNQIQGTG